MGSPQEDLLKIEAVVDPEIIAQGNEGTLKIKITPLNGIRISSHPEFMIKLDENDDLILPKVFFTGSELNFQTAQINGDIFLNLEKEIAIPFRVDERALIGRQQLNGEIIFTILSPDNWYIKTFQKFAADFQTKKFFKRKKK